MSNGRLTLKDAIKAGNLEAFIAQAEAEGVGAADAKRMFATLSEAAKPQQSKRQTSRSPTGDGSHGKRTR
jgi:hypothetical protein